MDFGYILKVEPTGFIKDWIGSMKRSRETKVFSLNNQKDRIAVKWGR